MPNREVVCMNCGGRCPGDIVNPLRPPCSCKGTYSPIWKRMTHYWIPAEEWEAKVRKREAVEK